MDKSLEFLFEKFEIGNDGKIVDGVTVVVNDAMKGAIAYIRNRDAHYESNVDVIRDVLFRGLEIIKNDTMSLG